MIFPDIDGYPEGAEHFLRRWERKIKLTEDEEFWKEFLKENRVTIEAMVRIGESLICMGDVFGIPFVNAHTIYLRDVKQFNSNLITFPKGMGKTTFVEAIADSNKKKTFMLPNKIYESKLSALSKKDFHEKVLLHRDFIQAYGGLNQKQREQLVGILTSVFSDGAYERQGTTPFVGVKTMGIFPMAYESFITKYQELSESTLLDRMTVVYKDMSDGEKDYILSRMAEDDIPKLKLKMQSFRSSQPYITKEILKECVNPIALEMDRAGVMSITRAHNYGKNFLRANAGINGRKIVRKSDVFLYKLIKNYHFNTLFLSKKMRVYQAVTNNPGLSDADVINRSGVSRASFYRHKKKMGI